jgi:hypothetical protein
MKDKLKNRINDYIVQLRKDTLNKKLDWRPVFNTHIVSGLKRKGIVLEAITNTGHRVFLYEAPDSTPTLEIPKTTVWTFGHEHHSFSVTSTEVDELYLDVIMPLSSPERRIAPITDAPSKLQISIGIAIVLGWFAFLIFLICS